MYHMDTLKGHVEHIIYRNEENLYTVLELVCSGKAQTVCGKFDQIDEGELIECEGEFVKHPMYGKQLKMQTYKSLLPEDTLAMKRYLGSGAIKGIGEAMASKIVDTFGDDTFRIIEEEPERLAEIKGISDKKARAIAQQFADKKAMREAMIFLQKFSITNNLAVKIFKQYGDRLYDILKSNPYALAEDIDGIGFRTADQIAEKAGISPANEKRIESGILYTLISASSEGHMYLPRNMLLAKSAQILELQEELVDPVIDNLCVERRIVSKTVGPETRMYSATSYHVELSCASMLYELAGTGVEVDADYMQRITGEIKLLEKEHGMALDDVQREAVAGAVSSGVFILSGGPGTGKTTTTKMIIEYFRSKEMSFLLAAPTGRAAKRMQEATGYEASTIHRMLELSAPEEGENVFFAKNEEEPLEADAIVIDEASMIDIYLLRSLLRAVSVGTRLIFVGDANQLPSVGPGQVLKDMISSGLFPTVVLTKIFRQAGESDIVQNAHLVHRGEHIELTTKSRDFFFLERNDADVIIAQMVKFITGTLPEYAKAKPLEIQVLSPTKNGPLGVISLNRELQRSLNPESSQKKELRYDETIYREGDKVMQIKNDYELEWEIMGAYNIPIARGLGVFNGDMGILTEVNHMTQTMTVCFDGNKQVSYPFALAEELELAYAVTVHKSQGSEYPGVIIPLLAIPPMLASRNILYTAITRAKNCCVLMGSRNVVYSMIDNDRVQMRYTGLVDVLGELTNRDQL